MENYQPIPATQLEELIFNDEQEAKVGAALQALADQITTTTRCSTQRKVQNEIIELLSDSDSDEVIVTKNATKQTNKLNEGAVQLYKHGNGEGTKENSINSQQIDASGSVNTKRVLALQEERKTINQSNNSQKYSTVAEFLEDEFDTLSAWSECSDTQYKFKYEQEQDVVEPTEKEMLPDSSKTYITLTDITGEEIQVEEINLHLGNEAANKNDEVVDLDEDDKLEELGEADQQEQLGEADQQHQLGEADQQHQLGEADQQHQLGEADQQHQLGEADQQHQLGEAGQQNQLGEADQQEQLGRVDQQEQLYEPQPYTLPKQNLQVQYEVTDVDVYEEEPLLQAKQEIDVEEPYMQQYYKEEITVKPDYYSNEDLSYRNSLDDSNGLNTMYGAELLNSYDETDDGCVELSDLATEQIMINLVDSDTDDERETTGYNTSTNESILEHKPSSTSIDCFMNYTCPQCSMECGSFADWKLHTDAEHKFSTIDALNMQTIIDKDGQLCYQCRDCEQKFELHKTFLKLLPHRFKHLPNELYIRCRLCAMCCRNKSQMRRHLIKMHYKICREYVNIPKAKRPSMLAIKYIKISCPICNQPQSNRKQWQDHLEHMHDFSTNITTQVNLLSNDIYKCTVCEVKLRKRSIMDHMLTHEKYKSFACTLCNKYEAGQFMLALTHVRRVHLMSDKELLFKCNYCEATFEKNGHRKQHLRLKHKVKWQKCAICHKEFFSISLLLSHMNFANHHKLK